MADAIKKPVMMNTEGLSKKEIFLMRPPNNTIILNYGPIPGR